MTELAKSPEWRALESHAAEIGARHIRDLFGQDSERLKWGRVTAGRLTVDFSKNRLNRETLELLMELAQARGLTDWRDQMTAGKTVNVSENRAALHMALRGGIDPAPKLEGEDIGALVAQEKGRMLGFVDDVHTGAKVSSSGKPFRHVVNLGIGGSDLGPRLVCDALRPNWSGHITPHFVSNVDATELAQALEELDPEATLFVVTSKSFATQETMANAATAKSWLKHRLEAGNKFGKHFVAVTANTVAPKEFGIDTDATFGIWDWVGGRYSVWSSVGLSVALALGRKGFEDFLSGAAEMDQHFLEAPLDANLPILLALVGVWNRNFLKLGSHAILPYAQSLELLPGYLQQLDMESNGKSVDQDGKPVGVKTAPILWGTAGTNGQHAFYQWLHQGTDMASADIILPLRAQHGHAEHHRILMAHGIAQGEAFAFGRDAHATRAELKRDGLSKDEIERMLPHRTFEGNRPVSTILMEDISPRSVGALLALYEHKITCQGAIWGINSFDQWGVELGKTMAGTVLGAIEEGTELDRFDPSTRALIESVRNAGSTDGEDS